MNGLQSEVSGTLRTVAEVHITYINTNIGGKTLGLGIENPDMGI